MSPSAQLYDTLKSAGVDFVISVPCKLLSEIIDLAAADKSITYTPVTREEEGIGIMAGAYMAGKKPAILMQNSGLGNSINAIHSLLNYCEIPVVFICSHRGSEGEPVEAQHRMGDAMRPLLEASGVRCFEIDSPDKLDRVKSGVEQAYADKTSASFLFPFSFWE